MKKYTKELVERELLDETICDKCLKPIETEGSFDAFNASLEVVTGDCYPEGCFTMIRTADFCQQCAEDLIEHLKGYGIRINERESL